MRTKPALIRWDEFFSNLFEFRSCAFGLCGFAVRITAILGWVNSPHPKYRYRQYSPSRFVYPSLSVLLSVTIYTTSNDAGPSFVSCCLNPPISTNPCQDWSFELPRTMSVLPPPVAIFPAPRFPVEIRDEIFLLAAAMSPKSIFPMLMVDRHAAHLWVFIINSGFPTLNRSFQHGASPIPHYIQSTSRNSHRDSREEWVEGPELVSHCHFSERGVSIFGALFEPGRPCSPSPVQSCTLPFHSPS